MICPSCGKSNPENSIYCNQCGSFIKPAYSSRDTTMITLTPVETELEQEEEIQVPEADLALGKAIIVIKRGPNAGTRFIITKEITTAGRHPESDIFLDDITVSRRHAEIIRTENGFKLVDKSSLNGTYANNVRVDETELSTGDEIQIGKFKLIVFFN